MTESIAASLARRQLDAYNQADLDAFCACYHDEVQVLDEAGAVTISGIADFRARYAPKFAAGNFGATVPERVSMGRHCVDRERYWVLDPDSGQRTEGHVLVRYSVQDERIAVVQFLR